MLDGLLARKPRILVLAPQRPAQHGNGSRVRSYHVIRALSGYGPVHLIQLPRHDGKKVSGEIRPYLASLQEEPNSPKPQRGNSPRKRRRFARNCVLAPWKVSQLDWLMEARRLSLGKMESEPAGNGEIPFRLRLRAATLLTEIGLAHRWMGIPPTDSISARALPELVLPMVERSPAGEGIDLIWLEHTHLLPLAEPLRRRFPGAKLVCNSHNVLSTLHEAHARIMASPIARRWHLVEARACREMERRGLAAMDQVFCCSEQDLGRIRELAPGARIRVWPNGVDPEFFAPRKPPDETPLLLLPGSMNYVPNSDGATWFAHQVLPKIRARIPSCRLRIAGRGASQTCGALAENDAAVEVLGNVPDMRPHFEQASIVIVPLRAGSGTRLKILEAMAMERPVVSTTIGAEGLLSEEEQRLLLADDEDQFAAAILDLLGDDRKRSELATEGRRFVSKRYDWNRLSATALRDS